MTNEQARFHYGVVIIVMGTLVVFGSLGLARFSYSLLLPSMQEGLGLDNTQAGAIATANLIGYLTLSVIGGALASRYGPRAVITVGLLVAAVSLFLTGLVQSFAGAAAWRAVSGIGSGASNVPVMGLLAAWFVPKRRGLAAGIMVTGSSFAIILLGPTVPRIVGEMGDSGWRISWMGLGAATFLLAVGSLVLLRNRPEALGLKPMGAGEDEPAPATTGNKPSWGMVYRSPLVWHIGLVYVAFGFSYIIYLTFFTKHLIADGGYTQAEAGQLFRVLGWCSLLCGLIWGSVSDAIGRKWALVMVYLIQAAAFALFALWPTTAGFTLSAVLFGLTAWSIPAIMAATCGDVLGSKLAPAGVGFVTLLFGIGQALGPSVAGAIADATGSFAPALLLAAGVAIVGAASSAALKKGL
ncbi:MAG: YbfB/YjiJ family MFS transporter [bacterium]|nr:YbfB/YjiJ family MFS transporter [bacterium]